MWTQNDFIHKTEIDHRHREQRLVVAKKDWGGEKWIREFSKVDANCYIYDE